MASPQTSASATSLLLDFAGSSRPSSRASSQMNLKSAAEQYSLSPSPRDWGMPLDPNSREPDDDLHNPDPQRDHKSDRGGTICTARGIENLGCLFIMVCALMMLFAGFPILTHFMKKTASLNGGFNFGGINATGQVPQFPNNFGLIDKDTPQEVYKKKSYVTGEDLVLVFSDEFNEDGRSFYPGDDPFWEAVDLHYWGTNDLEWYDITQPTTQGGALRLTLEQVDPVNNHNLSYRSGMIQSWNKFCFTGGLVETAVTLPGANNVQGFWPAMWAMGNLGRAGFGSTLDGMWPYSYDYCDVGTLPNQTYPGRAEPLAATQGGDPGNNGILSFLPGQRLSACTCPGESHPGPMRSDGSYVGRAAPEIDLFEALVDADGGKVSLSAQWAPYNAGYNWANTSDNVAYYDPKTILNSYKGGVYQQTTSGLTPSNQDCYELGKRCFSVYGFEYSPGEQGYITWLNDGKPSWSLRGAGMKGDSQTEISARQVSMEPMYLIANLGFSHNFAQIQLDKLTFPATMSIDYIRVYQHKNSINIGCDPKGYPTSDYIETYKSAYTNFNMTTWQQTGQPWPKNRLQNGKC